MKNSPRLGGLTRPREAVLDALLEQPDPVDIQALCRRLDRHHNTVREQLNWLIGRGLVRRYRVQGDGRGRPAWHYLAIGPKPGVTEHAELAAELAWTMSEDGQESDVASAREHGRRWGLAHAGERQDSELEARAATVEILDGFGFRPRADADFSQALLTRCPLLQAAHRFPEVVCSMHEGLVEGLLEAHHPQGEDHTESAGVTLVPFGDPGGCPLTLR